MCQGGSTFLAHEKKVQLTIHSAQNKRQTKTNKQTPNNRKPLNI